VSLAPELPAEVAAWDELVVVKLGGTTLADNEPVLDEVVEASARRRLVIVHGGGQRMTDWLSRLGIPSRFEQGLRVTDDAALDVALAVYGGLVNGELVAALNRRGVAAVGLSGVSGGLLVAQREPRLGRVARVVGAQPAVLWSLIAGGFVPVVAPLAADEVGVVCNVNADEVAAGLAAALHVRLVLLTDTDGVLGAHGERLAHIDEREAEQLIDAGIVRDGMLPKLRGALEALRGGAAEVVIADGRAPGALARSLDDDDFGTRLTPPLAVDA
jgi:acetylglutamate kinase